MNAANLHKRSTKLGMTRRKCYPQGIVQENKIWAYNQMVWPQTRICPRTWDTENSLRIRDINGSPNPSQTTRPRDNQQKERTCHLMDFIVSGDYWVKIKRKKATKIDKYLDFTREPKKSWSM